MNKDILAAINLFEKWYINLLDTLIEIIMLKN